MRGRFKWLAGPGQDYCRDCKLQDTACSKGQRGIDGNFCPLIENAPRTVEEIRAFEALALAGYDDPAGLMAVLETMGAKNRTVLTLAAEGCAGVREAIKEKS